jgi:hypothetical protein
VTVGHQSIDAAMALHSLRAHNGLRVLHTVLEPLHASPGVAKLDIRVVQGRSGNPDVELGALRVPKLRTVVQHPHGESEVLGSGLTLTVAGRSG